MRESLASGRWNFELFANGANRSFFDLPMARHAGNLPALRVEPDGMRAALTVEDAAVLAQVTLQVRGEAQANEAQADEAQGSGLALPHFRERKRARYEGESSLVRDVLLCHHHHVHLPK